MDYYEMYKNVCDMSEIGMGDVLSMDGIYWNMHATLYGICMQNVWRVCVWESVWDIYIYIWILYGICVE